MNCLKPRSALALLTLFATGAGSPARAATQPAARPNIVFILADDLGYTDVNAFAARLTGAKAAEMFYETPNLDRLTREGFAFSQAYACQLCSPTRSGVLTGRIAARIGVTTATPGSVRTFYNQGLTPPAGYLANDAVYWGDNLKIQQALLNGSTLDAVPAGQPLDQGRNEITIAEALTDYRSAFIGKWHLGSHGARGWQPDNQGFEPLAYTDEGGSPYFNWRGVWDNRRKAFPKMAQPELLAGRAGPDTGKEYLTDSLTETAVQFLSQQATQPERKPFFLYLCHLAVHTPLQGKAADVAYFEKKPTRGWNGHSNATYAAMLKSLDDSVGRILDTLARTGLAENTLVVFMSDNGGVTYTNPAATSNAPLKGGKAMMFEGGIRVPLVFRWPGKIAAGQWCNVPVDYADLFPTLLQFAHYEPAPHYARIDGRSLTSLLTDPTNQNHGYGRDTHYWHYPFNVAVIHPDDGQPLAPHSAIREGDFKLIFDWSGKLYLYDLKSDWREEHNLADAQSAKAKALFTKLNTWLDQNVAVKYTPLLNPDYDPAKEARPRPFVDLRRQLLGEKFAIRPASSDPRIPVLERLNAELAAGKDAPAKAQEAGPGPLNVPPVAPRSEPPGTRLPLRTKFTWALGSLGDNYAGNTISQLKDAVYTVALGVPPELIGWALSLPRLLDAFFDPVVGFWSDNWRGRWGRRRPFIFAGAIALGVTMAMLWLPPSGGGWSHRALAAYFLGATMLFYAAYSIFLVPYRALGLELTSDYHDRTRLQGWGMMVGLVGGLGLPWLYKLTLICGGAGTGTLVSAAVILSGARWVGVGVGALILITCLVPALACRENVRASAAPKIPLRAAIAATFRNRPFLHMLAMNFCATVGMYSPVTVSLLVSIYFLFQGNQDAAANLTGYLGMAQMLGSLAGVPVNTAVSVRVGKRRAALVALAIGGAGFASLWWTLLPANPYWAIGSQFLIGWGMQGVWLMSATMNADVCDSDELATGHRREGLYGAVFALEQKIAFAMAALLGGYLVSRCGYVTSSVPTVPTLLQLRATLVATPLVGLGLAAAFIGFYSLSRARVVEIQALLSARKAAPDGGA